MCSTWNLFILSVHFLFLLFRRVSNILVTLNVLRSHHYDTRFYSYKYVCHFFQIQQDRKQIPKQRTNRTVQRYGSVRRRVTINMYYELCECNNTLTYII